LVSPVVVSSYIPTHGQVEADFASLKKASKILDRLLVAKRIDVDAVVAEFKATRKRSIAPMKPAAVVA
jgi:ABC-type xylose transport system substrate-binding protein